MKISRANIDGQVKEFTEACDRLGIKVTHQRMEIYRVLIATEEHPDAASVYARVRKRIPTISLDTVYRNLRLLADHGLVSIVGMSQESVRFDGNMSAHHHFTCIRCGMIRDFPGESIADLKIPDAAQAFGAALSMHVEVKGICRECQSRRR